MEVDYQPCWKSRKQECYHTRIISTKIFAEKSKLMAFYKILIGEKGKDNKYSEEEHIDSIWSLTNGALEE